ncbi:MAG TPA: hypothetical protein VJQ81_17905 [Reyranella sp.]|jgi:hypothetical protein|nr:hypothetical protein [Reyranella sp.]
MIRTFALAFGVALGAITLGGITMVQAQQQDIMSRSRGSAGSSGLPGLGKSDGSSGAGTPGSAIPGGSTFSTTMPGSTIPMGAASQGARRPSLGPDFNTDLNNSLTMPRN